MEGNNNACTFFLFDISLLRGIDHGILYAAEPIIRGTEKPEQKYIYVLYEERSQEYNRHVHGNRRKL